MKRNQRTIIYIVLALVVLALIAVYLSTMSRPEKISYDELVSKIEAGEVKRIYVSTYKVKVLYNGSKIPDNYFPRRCDAQLNISYRTQLEDQIYRIASQKQEAGEDFTIPKIEFDDPNSGAIWSTIIPILGLVALGVLLLLMFRSSQSSNNKAMNFGKTKARVNQNIKVRFSDVAGAEEEKEELQEIVEFLKNPQKFIDVGARIPKGVLLVGQPGTGKTLFAKAVAGEARVPFFSISGSDFVEMFVGVGASRVRDLFDQARRNKPCIVFIDEIDAVGRQRGTGLGGGHDEREQTLNQLLVQMDGFDTQEGIIIMAATNRADILDPALLRPGRFDRQIYVHVPDVRGREAIFKVHARNKPLSGDINFQMLARITTGFTGAEIENLLNEAAILAARAGRKVIIKEDIFEGIDKVVMGAKKKSRVVTESDKRITAYHEAGHAIIAKVLPLCDEVQEVSIVPRGMAAGYTLTRPDNDDSHVSKNKLLDNIVMMLGGRAAETIFIKDISTGASDDLSRATSIAKKMITEWGMSDTLGNSCWTGEEREVFIGRDFGTQKSYSEEIAGKIDEEIKKIIDSSFEKAIAVLKENKTVLENMVKLLYERDTIYFDEVDMLFEGKTAKEVLEYINAKDAAAQPVTAKVEPEYTVSDLVVPEKPEVKEDAQSAEEPVEKTADEPKQDDSGNSDE